MEKIKEFQNQYRFLSNYWPVKITYEGLIYLSSEAAFQAAKTLDMEKRKEFTTMVPGTSKKAGRFLDLRDDWEYIKRKIMYDIVKIKFTENQELKGLLLDTYPLELEEGNKWNDTYWGVCDGKGSNVLGFILMLIRAELMIEN